jgi:hypothetical protein
MTDELKKRRAGQPLRWGAVALLVLLAAALLYVIYRPVRPVNPREQGGQFAALQPDGKGHEAEGGTSASISVDAFAGPVNKSTSSEKHVAAREANVELGDEIRIPSGINLTVRTAEALSSRSSLKGDTFVATLAKPIDLYGRVVPAGSQVTGTVLDATPATSSKSGAKLRLRLDFLILDGKAYRFHANEARLPKHTTTAGSIALGGALIGGLAGGGKGAAMGAAAGSTNGYEIVLPPDSLLNFRPLSEGRPSTEGGTGL